MVSLDEGRAEFPKRCGCCGAVYTKNEWESLRFMGTWPLPDGVVLELRNCPCDSTLAVEVRAP